MKAELIRRLLEYQKYKDAGEKLAARPIEGRNVFGRGGSVEVEDGGLAPQADESVWKLIAAFGRILEKATPDKAIDALKQFGGTVVKTSLSDEDTAKLQEALTPTAPAAV